MKKIIEQITIYASLLLGMDFFFVVIYGDDIRENTLGSLNAGDVHIAEAIITLLIYAAVGLFLIMRLRKSIVALKLAWPFLLLNAFALLSSAWSITPDLTLRRAGYFLATTIVGVYLASRLSIRELSNITIRVFLLFFLCSLIYLVVAPSFVLDTAHENAFRGLTSHKNTMGLYAGFFIILVATLPTRKRIFQIFCLALGAAALYTCHSGAAVVSCAATLAFLPALQALRFTKKQLLPVVVVTSVLVLQGVLFLSNSFDQLLDFLGKDRTFTGRSQIWDLLLISISRRPFTGYGFDSFWQGLRGESLNIIAGAGWLVPAAHNGYLEVLLGLGVIGMALTTVCLVLLARLAIGYARRVPGLEGLWPAAYLLYMLLHATAESTLIMRDSICWMLLVFIFVALKKEQYEFKRASRHAVEAPSSAPFKSMPTRSRTLAEA